MRKTGIVVLSDYVGSTGHAAGGAGGAAYESYVALRNHGLTVSLITGFGLPDQLSGDPTALSLGRSDLRSGSRMDAVRTIYDPASRSALAIALQDYDPERTVIILHQWTRALTPAALAALGRFRLMIYMHDYFWTCPNGAYFNFVRSAPCACQPFGTACMTTSCDRAGYAHKAVRLLREAARRRVVAEYRHAPVHLHISKHALATAQPLIGGTRHAVIYNPTTTNGAACGPVQPLYDVGFFGRLEPEKGVELLRAALAEYGLKGLFVGEGRLANQIEQTGGMRRLPWQPSETVGALMRQCRVVALPSLWPETWGLVTAEAMSAGVPVLVSSRAGSAELVDRFGGGVIFDPASRPSLDSVLGLLRSGISIAPLNERGRNALGAFLSPERHAKRIADLIFDYWGMVIPRLTQRPKCEAVLPG